MPTVTESWELSAEHLQVFGEYAAAGINREDGTNYSTPTTIPELEAMLKPWLTKKLKELIKSAMVRRRVDNARDAAVIEIDEVELT